ncbi:hypothetical protein PFISCL1PPCAC_10199, partial [Pristionchus fissidentatus]
GMVFRNQAVNYNEELEDKAVTDKLTYYSVRNGRMMEVPKDVHTYGGCRKVNEFEKLNRVGAGTYGVVYRARDTKSKEIVALKKMRREVMYRGISESILREVTLLTELRHENIVKMKEVAVGKDVKSIFLVMEFCEQDLTSVMQHYTDPFNESQIKCLLQQLLSALVFLHEHFVIHRDLKLSNLLLNGHGILKVADFGLARTFADGKSLMTPCVVTLWYRAPELLFGSQLQSGAIDLWAVGCILGELILHSPLLPGQSEIDQINRIIQLLGTPNVKLWPELNDLPNIQQFTLRDQPFNNIKTKFDRSTQSTMDLLNDLFIYNPQYRISARKALKHKYFDEYPPACDPLLMPTYRQHRNE